jgi:hypothetical protein
MTEGADTERRIQDVEARVAALRKRVGEQDSGLQKFMAMFVQYFEIQAGTLSDHNKRLEFKEREFPEVNGFAARVSERCRLSNSRQREFGRMVEESNNYQKERVAHLESALADRKKDSYPPRSLTCIHPDWRASQARGGSGRAPQLRHTERRRAPAH